MTHEELAQTVERTRALDRSLARNVAVALSSHRSGLSVSKATLRSIESVLEILDQTTPGWTIELRGTAHDGDGHWHCALRPSTNVADAGFIAHSSGPVLSNVLTAALLRAVDYLDRHNAARALSA